MPTTPRKTARPAAKGTDKVQPKTRRAPAKSAAKPSTAPKKETAAPVAAEPKGPTEKELAAAKRTKEKELRDAAKTALAAPGVESDRIARLRAAEAETKTLSAWKSDGEKGERPASPNKDVVDAVYAAKEAGITIRESGSTTSPNGSAGSKPKEPKTPKGPSVPVQFFIGERKLSPTQNKLSCIAYQATAGISESSPARIGVSELVDLLAALGVSDPHATTWKATLPNGKVVGCYPVADSAAA